MANELAALNKMLSELQVGFVETVWNLKRELQEGLLLSDSVEKLARFKADVENEMQFLLSPSASNSREIPACQSHQDCQNNQLEASAIPLDTAGFTNDDIGEDDELSLIEMEELESLRDQVRHYHIYTSIVTESGFPAFKLNFYFDYRCLIDRVPFRLLHEILSFQFSSNILWN